VKALGIKHFRWLKCNFCVNYHLLFIVGIAIKWEVCYSHDRFLFAGKITMAYPNDQQGKALPFFARFLSVSKEESSIKSPSPEHEMAATYKFPSDWEDW
jgi:hypothetical protein